jgi:hypothetical protein
MLFDVSDEIKNLWVVEWSPTQKQFHVCTVEEMLEVNTRIFEKKTQGEYFPITVCKSVQEAQTICNASENWLKAKTP